MIYLIGEIMLYLLAAMLVGTGAGWLLRDWRGAQGAAVERAAATGPVDVVMAPAEADARAARLEVELAQARARALQVDAEARTQVERLDALTRRLATAERRVEELERERALQNRALQVLHQQLEFAIERRTTHPGRMSGSAA
jgi:hypothetical protein